MTTATSNIDYNLALDRLTGDGPKWSRRIPVTNFGQISFAPSHTSYAVVQDWPTTELGPPIEHFTLPYAEPPLGRTLIQFQINLSEPLWNNDHREFVDVETVLKKVDNDPWREFYKIEVSADGRDGGEKAFEEMLMPKWLTFGLISLIPAFKTQALRFHYCFDVNEDRWYDRFNYVIYIDFEEADPKFQECRMFPAILRLAASALNRAQRHSMTVQNIDRPLTFTKDCVDDFPV